MYQYLLITKILAWLRLSVLLKLRDLIVHFRVIIDDALLLRK